MPTPPAPSTPTQTIVSEVAKAVLRDLQEHGGYGVERLLGKATCCPAPGQAAVSLAQHVAAWRAVLPSNIASRTVPIGECAVLYRSLPGVRALAGAGGPSVMAGMVKRAAQAGWEEGLAIILSVGRESLKSLFWRDMVLEHAMTSPGVFRLLIDFSMRQPESWCTTSFFSTVNESINVTLAMAMSAQPEAFWEIARERQPAMIADMQHVGEPRKYDRGAWSEFFKSLAAHCVSHGGIGDTALDFLATHICRTHGARWRLALTVAQHGTDAGQLERACRRDPELLATVAREIGTARGVRRMVETLVRRNAWSTGAQEDLMPWVVAIAPLGGRTPDLRSRESDDSETARLLAGWMGVRAWMELDAKPSVSTRRRLRS